MGDIPTTWVAPRDRLGAELAPQSLADRVLVEGIERIACRVRCAAYYEGFAAGTDAGYDFALMWIAALLDDPRFKPRRAAYRALCVLADRIERDRHPQPRRRMPPPRSETRAFPLSGWCSLHTKASGRKPPRPAPIIGTELMARCPYPA